MAPLPSPEPPPTPPLGSWPLVYALVCGLAIAVMLALWWFTSHYNVRLGAA